jgi:hypothetical protein
VSSHQLAYAQKRRSTRIDQAVALLVQGVGAMREPYQEQVSTLSISCHGCTYLSKHEVIQGETVYLDVKAPTAGSTGYSSRAHVKWVQKAGAKERIYQIAVELEIAGNIWGLPSAPEDWFPPRIMGAIEPAAPGRDLKVVARTEQPAVTAPVRATDRITRAEANIPSAAPAQPLAQLMVGLGEQIQFMASEAASTALVTEKNRLLEEVRGQVRGEIIKATHAAIAASKDVIVSQAMKEFSQTHEAAVRNNYALWMNQIEKDMENARQHMLVQRKEVSQAMETMVSTTVERVQHHMETARSEAVDRFVARLRNQVGPILTEAQDSLKKLESCAAAFRKESAEIHAGLENQLATSASNNLAKTREELEKNTAAVAAKANETLLRLYRDFEKTAQKNMESLLVSIGSQMNKAVQEKAAEVTREFSSGLEDQAQSYLESLGKSIAEIPRKLPGSSR